MTRRTPREVQARAPAFTTLTGVTSADDRRFPAARAAVLALPGDYAGGDGIDFEPFAAFLSADETTEWLRAWTDNPEVSGDAFRVFGQDGSGGYAALWLHRPERPLPDQPVVLLGSEGEAAVVAGSPGDFRWLLAGGYGPAEAGLPHDATRAPCPHPAFVPLARHLAPERERTAAAVLARAAGEGPAFDATITRLCR